MAKSDQSAFLPSLSGRVGGLVVRRSSGGSLISSAPVVRRNSSALQRLQRGFLGDASRAWATLSAADRRAWGYVALGGEAGILNVTPSLQAGLPTFLRWYQCFLWCGQTPAGLRPDVQVFDPATVFTPSFNLPLPNPKVIYKTGNPSPAGVAVWAAHASVQGEPVSRPVWQLIAATGAGDATPWVWNVAPFFGAWSVNLSTFLSARLWCPVRPYTLMLRVRSTLNSGTAVLRNDSLAVIV